MPCALAWTVSPDGAVVRGPSWCDPQTILEKLDRWSGTASVTCALYHEHAPLPRLGIGALKVSLLLHHDHRRGKWGLVMETAMPNNEDTWLPTVQVFAVKHADGPICIETRTAALSWRPGKRTINRLPAVVSEWIAAGTLSSGRLMIGLCVPAHDWTAHA